MEVEIANFPETKITVVKHHGAPEKEYESVKRLVAWRIENKLPPSGAHRSYGIHYNDPHKVAPSEYRVDICVSVEKEVPENLSGILNKVIPALLCAKARHFGSRKNIAAAKYLYEEWLPKNKELLAEFPIFFHYVNIGSQIQESDMVTDVYLPIH